MNHSATQNRFHVAALVAGMAFLSVLVAAENPAKRLLSPATAKGFVGGESQDSYVIHAQKGQIMVVRITWKKEHDRELGDNHAEFSVSAPDDSTNGRDFGIESPDHKSWHATIPETKDYYIYVMAYPSAHYTLSVTLNSPSRKKQE